MLNLFINILLPFALGVVRAYTLSPSDKSDNRLLDSIKDSVDYFACKDNNTVGIGMSSVLKNSVVFPSTEGIL